VEEVPHALFFHREQGFHGTFWHDRFGTPVSHGCVNLSLADAEWLFDWAPPRLPPGWHAVTPLAGQESLWPFPGWKRAYPNARSRRSFTSRAVSPQMTRSGATSKK
jgi:hypothetical protein